MSGQPYGVYGGYTDQRIAGMLGVDTVIAETLSGDKQPRSSNCNPRAARSPGVAGFCNWWTDLRRIRTHSGRVGHVRTLMMAVAAGVGGLGELDPARTGVEHRHPSERVPVVGVVEAVDFDARAVFSADGEGIARSRTASPLFTGSPKSEYVATADATRHAGVQDDDAKRFLVTDKEERHMSGEHGGCCCNHDDQHDNHAYVEGVQVSEHMADAEGAGCCNATKGERAPRSNDHAEHSAVRSPS